ncbi:hypothetical protein CTKA_00601 [Chthonomonas calidirosea]|uniref:Uncharacterized protein n=1 Tax=Chthonomonas calidirosea (strain DSM 23976 / ICMP 18418 / T49) TaxID=1303518 RepID=S0ETF9_CHTCT|nr:hypothetical protein [Chthonomonas calidirosea]CCW34385.1 hypothetical protein CCALI_00554 [Chthonomonas calidirosea T49]CEK14926.1 hypothetical protein CTKA_00601 [Chthonomonas calidirosea]
MRSRVVNRRSGSAAGFIGLMLLTLPLKAIPPSSVLSTARQIVVLSPIAHSLPTDIQKELEHQKQLLAESIGIRLPNAPHKDDTLIRNLPLFGSPKAVPLDKLPSSLQLPVAQTLLNDAFQMLLQQRFAIETPTASTVEQKARTLGIPLTWPVNPVQICKLCRALHMNYAIVLHVDNLKIQDGSFRIVILHATLHVLSVSSADKLSFTPLPIVGFAQIAHVFLHSNYELTQADAIRLAALQAAQMGLHALETGQTSPFAPPSVHLAILPVPAPQMADAILFKSSGRVLLVGAQNLPTDRSDLLSINLLPLSAQQIYTPDATKKTLVELHLTPLSLWHDETPDTQHLQSVEKQMKADYLLCFRITDLELRSWIEQSVTTDISTPQLEGSAEAVGYLIDGKNLQTLWHHRVIDTMRVSAPISDQQAVQTVLRDAMRFALSDLSVSMQNYLKSFTR